MTTIKSTTQRKPTAQPTTVNFAATPAPARPSPLLDTRVIHCGDNLEQLAKPALTCRMGSPTAALT